jgi:beta-glucosidase
VSRDIAALVAELTLDEKAALTAGQDLWATVPIERVGIPSWQVTDGPNGARGAALTGTSTSVCVPCGSGLGSTWDEALMEEIGAVIGRQARTKSCRVLLAPTVNLHRSPLGGRTFESYGEDPFHVGKLAAAFVRGAQSEGVATTVKHFAGNEAEFERFTINSIVDARALRELYLMPFELAVREGGAFGIMTSYNRLNGPWCSEDPGLLGDILRGDWGFEGFVVTDWFAVASTDVSPRAGLDLEMPGPGRAYGTALADAVRAGTVDEKDLDAIVTRLLTVFDRLGAFGDGPHTDDSVDLPEDRALARRAATASTVLLRNDGTLPFDATAISTLAVIGPNADRAQLMGGGSASLRPHYRITPLEALRARLGDRVRIVHEPGVDIDRTVPPIDAAALTAPDGSAGLAVECFAGHELAGEPVFTRTGDGTSLLFFGTPDPAVPPEFSARARGTFTPPATGTYTFTLSQAGRARLLVDGDVLLDGMTNPPPRGDTMFGQGSQEISATRDLAADAATELQIEFTNEDSPGLSGVIIGARRAPAPDQFERAIAAARDADAVVVIVGTNDDWETEGHDRDAMDLPGAQDDLVRAVVSANRNTAVVLNTGSPVTLPWAEAAPAVLQMWFGGQEMADGLVDVLFGDADPGGRLATTFPYRVEHTPAFGNFPGADGEVRYGEGVLMGYRWYEARRLDVQYPFGHGLSYTTFRIDEPTLATPTFTPGGELTLTVPVLNVGARAGTEVVQCYVAPLEMRITRPPKELKGFAKVSLEPGERAMVSITLDDRAFSYWDPGQADRDEIRARTARSPVGRSHADVSTDPGWRIDAGTYALHIGRSSADIAHVVEVDVVAG